MNRYIVLTLGLALALPCVGAWAIDNGNTGAAGDQGTQLQAPAAQDQNQTPAPPTATPQNPAPPNTAPPDQNAAPPTNPPADQNAVAPNNAAPNTAPAPNNAAPNTATPDNTQPNNAQPNPAPANPPVAAAPMNGGASISPLRQFVSAQVNEVGELSDQMDMFRAAKRSDAVMAMYHMIRDHTLLADAGRDVLARRGEVSQPIIAATPLPGNTPDEILQHDVQAHQQALSEVQQLLANSSDPDEKRIYQQAVNAINKHLGWLTAMNQGQTVQIGFFDPTTPLSMIAGYRETTPTPRVAGYRETRQSRRSVSHRRYHHRRHRRYSRVRYYR